jgi:hypothetical protein
MAKTVKITAQSSAIGQSVRTMYEATGLRLAIDEDCPGCGWPERWFNGTVFGCNKCEYTGETRDG